MTKALTTIGIALATAAILSGSAFAQSTAGAMMTSGDHMSPVMVKHHHRAHHRTSGAMSTSDHMAAGQMTDHMSSGAMSSGDHMSSGRMSDHMSGGAMSTGAMTTPHQ